MSELIEMIEIIDEAIKRVEHIRDELQVECFVSIALNSRNQRELRILFFPITRQLNVASIGCLLTSEAKSLLNQVDAAVREEVIKRRAEFERQVSYKPDWTLG